MRGEEVQDLLVRASWAFKCGILLDEITAFKHAGSRNHER
jgi:hypothetical protein